MKNSVQFFSNHIYYFFSMKKMSNIKMISKYNYVKIKKKLISNI